MTENKRFKLRLSKLGNGMITDTQKRKHLYFDKKFLDATLPKTNEWLNELADENEQLKFENNELKCALALDAVDYIIADGKKIDIPPYYEFEQRYDHVMHRRGYDGYD